MSACEDKNKERERSVLLTDSPSLRNGYQEESTKLVEFKIREQKANLNAN